MDTEETGVGDRTPTALRVPPGLRPLAADLRLAGRAAAEKWPISDDARRKAVEQCLAVLDMDDSPRTIMLKMIAVKTLALLDKLNAYRDRTSVAEKGQDLRTRLAALRGVLGTETGRKLLCELTAERAAQQAEAQRLTESGPEDARPSESS